MEHKAFLPITKRFNSSQAFLNSLTANLKKLDNNFKLLISQNNINCYTTTVFLNWKPCMRRFYISGLVPPPPQAQTTVTATITSRNKKLYEQKQSFWTCVLNLLHFCAILYKTTTRNDQIQGIVENVNRRQWILHSLSSASLERHSYKFSFWVVSFCASWTSWNNGEVVQTEYSYFLVTYSLALPSTERAGNQGRMAWWTAVPEHHAHHVGLRRGVLTHPVRLIRYLGAPSEKGEGEG